MTSFKYQSGALFRNKATYQKRNIATNICLLTSPLLFCILLAVIQLVVNKTFLGVDTYKCGCRCMTCCSSNNPGVCPLRDYDPYANVTVDRRYLVCDGSEDLKCERRDTSTCGIQYSTQTQSGFCAVERPVSWPASTTMPQLRRRAATLRPAIQNLVTAASRSAAQAFASLLVRQPVISPAQFAPVNRTASSNLYYSLSQLGLVVGTSRDPIRNLYLDYNYLTRTETFLLVPNGTCTTFYALASNMPAIAPQLVKACDALLNSSVVISTGPANQTIVTANSTSWDLSVPSQAQQWRLFRSMTCGANFNSKQTTLPLQQFLQVAANVTGSLTAATAKSIDTAFLFANNSASYTADDLLDFNNVTVACTDNGMVVKDSLGSLNDELYCGYYQTRCGGVAQVNNQTASAWDFADSSSDNLRVDVYYNRTIKANDERQGPSSTYRIPGLISQAVGAWWKNAVGEARDVVPPTELLGWLSTPKGTSSLELDFSSLLGPLFYTWVVQLLLPTFLQQLVYEKEKRLRMMMKMHGLGDGVYWLVTYTWFLALYLVYIGIFLICGAAINLKMFRKTSWGIQIVFYFLHGNCMIAFAFVMSSLFSSSKVAIVFAFLYVFATGLIGELLLKTFMNKNVLWVFFIEWIPAFALYRGLNEMSQYTFLAVYRNEKNGMQFSNLRDSGNGMLATWLIFLVEWAVFLLLAWYLEQVVPTGNGIRRHPLFCLGAPWGKKSSEAYEHHHDIHQVKPIASTPPGTVSMSVKEDGEMNDVEEERRRVERLHEDSEHPIIVRDLKKVFPGQDGGKKKVAVRSLTLGIERGECFGLLGPNGAGKTTSISMLVGFLEPSGGNATVEGKSIRTDMREIYKMMGVCPQHDLLWEQLTAREHLLFYGRLKGMKGADLTAAVEKGLKSVNLFAGGVADKQAGKYSGGMKRRLSVAISFMGTPNVVYLDEPSTGLDPASRRNLWEVVRSNKEGRAIILTTHSMEEAEMLCDRLGIFVDGQLVCIGNPKEITSRYAGYYVFTLMVPKDQEKVAKDFVQGMSRGAVLTYALGGTLKYELPSSEVTLSEVFAVMNEAKQGGKLTVLDWSVANATLEEVFIKLARSLGAKSKDS